MKPNAYVSTQGLFLESFSFIMLSSKIFLFPSFKDLCYRSEFIVMISSYALTGFEF